MVVQIVHGRRKLQHQCFDLRRQERLLHILLQRLQIVLQELHDEIYPTAPLSAHSTPLHSPLEYEYILIKRLPHHDLPQLHNMPMPRLH